MKKSQLLISALASAVLLMGCSHQVQKSGEIAPSAAEVQDEKSVTKSDKDATGTPATKMNQEQALGKAPQTQVPTNPAESNRPVSPHIAKSGGLDEVLCLSVHPNIKSTELVALIHAGMEEALKPVSIYDGEEKSETCKNGYALHYGFRTHKAPATPVKGKKSSKNAQETNKVVIDEMQIVIEKKGVLVLSATGPAENGDLTGDQIKEYARLAVEELLKRYANGQLNTVK